MVMFNDPNDKYRELESWRELLRPYLQAMRDAGLRVELPPLHTDAEREDLWFSMHIPSHEQSWQQIVKGMEWLDLIARVDRDCAWRLLFESSGNHAYYLLPLYGEKLWNTYSGPVYPQYELKILSGSDSYRGDTDLDKLSYLVQNDRTDDPIERSLKRMLVSRVNDRLGEGRTLNRRVDGYVKLRLSVKIYWLDTQRIETTFRELKYLVQRLECPSNDKFYGVYPLRNQERGVFRCHSYGVTFRDGPLTDGIVEALHRLEDVPVPLTRIVAPPMYFSHLQRHSVSCFLAATTSLTVGQLDNDGVRAFFSEIATTEGSLPALDLNPGFRDPDDDLAIVAATPARPEVYWPWLAYALFSSKAKHNCASLKICIQGLTAEHVTMMKAVLLHDDPLELLKQTETGAIVPSVQPPMCWPRPPRPTLWPHTIRHLSITSWWTLGESFFALLELVGEPLTRLSLSEIGHAPRDLLLDSVFMYCPNLLHLDLDMLHIGSLDWFQDRYRPCHKLETLCLGGMGAVGVDDDEMGSWIGLFITLSDPSHPLTNTLRELHISFMQVAMAMPRNLQVTPYNALLFMLDRNERLTRIEVAQCPLWMVEAYKDRVQANPKLHVAPAIARRVCGFYPRRRHQARDLF